MNTSGDGFIGGEIGSNGVVIIESVDSSWRIGGALTVGGTIGAPGGTGLLRIQHGGPFGGYVFADSITVGGSGTLEAGPSSAPNTASAAFTGGIRPPVNGFFENILRLDTPLVTFDGGTLRALADIATANKIVTG